MKGIATIIAITLIVILSIALAGTAYLWIRPLIEKRQDTIKVSKLLGDFDQKNPDSLPRKIEYVAKTGGEVSFTIDAEGMWVLYSSIYAGPENNSIQFSTFSKVSNVAVGVGWISYTPGGTCPMPNVGRIGEPASIICINATTEADGYILTYRATFRELVETPERIYKIELIEPRGGDLLRSTEKTIVLKFAGSETVGNKIITRVLVLL